MKIKRILSGLILVAILAIILILGNTTVVNISISIIAMISINEYFNSFKGKYNVDKWVGNIMAILLAFIGIQKLLLHGMKTNYADIAITGFGIIYIIGFILFIPLIYSLENGKILIWYLAIAAWGTDTFAYFTGIRFGKHKLTSISPKKTMEGSIGGIIGTVIISLIYTYIINKTGSMEISYLAILAIAMVLSILSEIGDLAASSIKRYTGIKDFGELIPGHGGMLDRIDSILFIAPFAYFLLNLI